ncbi:unnamed protein product [Rhizoctonia solani]|uniref:Uncharacterized protein n=1 Tax=Rhizoctonia solani TaxID=456999 RepID=A0A8H3C1W9_9AGAM|nr:unnamed protein product [Rhizoctonia solani]
MPLPVSGPCSTGSNYSSLISSTRDSTQKCLLQFSDRFLDPTDEISKWHEQQYSRLFRTIQYRKEKTGIGHEFTLLLLQREHGGGIDRYCRVERIGDPEHLAQVACIDGTIAEDYIQAISLSDPSSSSLMHNSDVVAEITFPLTFELRDVLAICYGISKHFRAKRYTLQQYNCYFFSWTIILALARACMSWDISPSILEHVDKIRGCMMQSIYNQGPLRFRSIAYIMSNKALAGHGNEVHPLDQAIKSLIYTPRFAESLAIALRGIFWPNRLQIALTEAMKGELKTLASESIALITVDGVQSGAINNPIMQDKRHLDFKYALGRLTHKAIFMALENTLRAFPQSLAALSPTCVLIKQRLGHEVWCKALMHCLRQPKRLFFPDFDDQEIPRRDLANPHAHQLIELPIRDLGFILPSVMLGLSARFMVTCGLTMGIFMKRVEYDFKAQNKPNKNVLQRMTLRVGITARSAALEIRAIPGYLSVSKHMVLFSIGAHVGRQMDPTVYELLEQLARNSELETTFVKSLYRALEVFDRGLQRLIEDDPEYEPSLSRPSITFCVNSMLNLMGYDIEAGWSLVLRQYFLDIMTEVAKRELEGLIGQANVEHMFQVRKVGNGLSRVDILDLCSSRGVAQLIKSVTLPQESPITSHNPDSWSYQDLQQYIRERITQLSKREINFASCLKHIPFAKHHEVCQKEIETTMEEIWQTSAQLIRAQLHNV